MRASVDVFIDQEDEYSLAVNDVSGIRQHRAVFVHNLGVLLRQTGADVESCDLLPGDRVMIKYRNGARRFVDVEADSCLAIVLDVARSV